jgi:hypothetical protein
VPVGQGGGVVPHPDSVTGPAEALLPPSTVQFACALTVSPFTPMIGMAFEPEEPVRLKVLVDVLPFTVTDSLIGPPVEGNELKVKVARPRYGDERQQSGDRQHDSSKHRFPPRFSPSEPKSTQEASRVSQQCQPSPEKLIPPPTRSKPDSFIPTLCFHRATCGQVRADQNTDIN